MQRNSWTCESLGRSQLQTLDATPAFQLLSSGTWNDEPCSQGSQEDQRVIFLGHRTCRTYNVDQSSLVQVLADIEATSGWPKFVERPWSLSCRPGCRCPGGTSGLLLLAEWAAVQHSFQRYERFPWWAIAKDYSDYSKYNSFGCRYCLEKPHTHIPTIVTVCCSLNFNWWLSLQGLTHGSILLLCLRFPALLRLLGQQLDPNGMVDNPHSTR